MPTFVTRSQEETFALGRALGATLAPGDVVLLRGDLGVGKSVLARGMASALGITGPMPSPTFTLMQPYEGRLKFYHFDLYRLSGEDEFFAAGLDDYLGGDGVSAVEWPDCAELSDEGRVRVTIARGETDDERVITIDDGRADA